MTRPNYAPSDAGARAEAERLRSLRLVRERIFRDDYKRRMATPQQAREAFEKGETVIIAVLSSVQSGGRSLPGTDYAVEVRKHSQFDFDTFEEAIEYWRIFYPEKEHRFQFRVYYAGEWEQKIADLNLEDQAIEEYRRDKNQRSAK